VSNRKVPYNWGKDGSPGDIISFRYPSKDGMILNTVLVLQPYFVQTTKDKSQGAYFSGLKLEVTANKFEVDAKWKAFKESVLNEYTSELVDGKPTAISKENEYKSKELSELLNADENIQGLLEGRKQGGLNAKDREKEVSIEGIPFKLPANPTSEQRQKAIQNYLLNDKGLKKISPEYAKQYAELNKKILNG